MDTKSVLILGSGHLAHRTKKLMADRGYTVVHFPNLFSQLPSSDSSTINETKKAFGEISPESFDMAYILYENDEDNLEIVIVLMALYPELKVATALFNENIRPHLEAANPKLTILNPAKISAPFFIGALEKQVNQEKHSAFKSNHVEPVRSRHDRLIRKLIVTFVLIALSAATYFHLNEGLTWLDSLYFVVVTISTVGYGDINLKDASDLSKVVGIALILCSLIFIWFIFSLLIDRIIKRRAELALGRKVYNYKDHIILCGLGRLGFFVAEELVQKGEKVVIIESSEQSANTDHFRNLNVDVYIGNARKPGVLKETGVERCRALISVINDDYANLEIGLNARSFQPDLLLVLRIFDESMAMIIKEKFNIHLTQSMSFIAAEKFASLLEKDDS